MMMRKIFYLLGILMFLNSSLSGQIDDSFSFNGYARTNIFGTNYGQSYSSVLQPDGKILVGGWSKGGTEDFCLSRYNADGSPDITFGYKGTVVTRWQWTAKGASVAIQPDGKILMAGLIDNNIPFRTIAIVRYNVDGSCDHSFGDLGKVELNNINGSHISVSLDIQADGKIIAAAGVVGYLNPSSCFVLIRLTQDGSLDNSFGEDGISANLFGYESHADIPYTVKVLQNEKILVAGVFDSIHGCIVRYYVDGTIDDTFGNNGISTMSHGYFESLIVDDEGDILGVGSAIDTTTWYRNFYMSRFSSEGLIDDSFGINGHVYTGITNESIRATDFVVDSNGDITVIGNNHNGSITINDNPDIIMTRYTEDGSLLNSFGDDGVLRTDLGQSEFATSILHPQENTFVVTGFTGPIPGESQHNFLILHYYFDETNGLVLDSLNSQVSSQPSSEDVGLAMVLQPDNKILVAGNADAFPALVRYDESGARDYSFGNGGISYHTIQDTTASVALDPDNKIILTCKKHVIRFNENGAIDSQFGTDGILLFDTITLTQGLALPNGKIVLSGYTMNEVPEFVLMRYNTNGAPDNSFGSLGQVVTGFNNQGDFAYSMALQPDGKIVLAGDTRTGSPGTFEDTDFCIARYNENGDLDNQFGVNGLVSTNLSNAVDHCNSIVLQPDGKILVTGESDNAFVLLRYQSDGILDNLFGDQGVVYNDTIARGNKPVLNLEDERILVLVNNNRTIAFDFQGNYDPTYYNTDIISLIFGEGVFNDMVLQPDGKVMLTGRTGEDFLTCRILENGVNGIQNFENSRIDLKAYPNPFSQGINLEFDLPKNEYVSFLLSDITGRTLHYFEETKPGLSGSNSVYLPLNNNLSAGTYLITVFTKSLSESIVIVKK
jgi:uncharacterized delta-60 repeat protein